MRSSDWQERIATPPQNNGHHYGPGHRSDDHFPFIVGGFVREMDEVFENMDKMFRDMDDIFKGMDKSLHDEDGATRPNGSFGNSGIFPGFPGAFGLPPSMKEPETLRDHMLKKPDDLPNDDSLSERKSISDKPKVKNWDDFASAPPNILPNTKKDSDIDGKGNLDELFGPIQRDDQPVAPYHTPQPRSFFKSISVRSVRTPDGKVEEHRTVTDETGRQETTVTKSLDNETHSFTTVRHPDGSEETKENFSNPQGNTDDFGKKWNFSNPIESPDEMLPTLGDPSRDSIFAKIFGRDFFGGKS